ncbi:SPOR domain-containing protein [Zunongwangia sp. HRR-M8]|uniref:HU domain-containing protein n=1 Tax=Zunongwangia sp. HRR-M8 TaxID=3015170 RepID=UPI0022DE2A0C|nr:SPOR domain-containing protein [Zunongwangia sp. HRR-M8]WBL22425.1 SPOR domain-containing protein [Zunongwangia sp. HRR-M8]
MKIANYIQDLLYRYECVIVPGFGAFLSQRESAFLDAETNSLYPPKKTVSFNRQLVKNDGLLANYVAEAESINYTTALNKIADFVHQLESSLKDQDKVEITNIGQFTVSEDFTLQFEPFNKVNYLADSFGLDVVHSAKIQREVYKTQVQEIEEKAPIHFTPERRNRKAAFLKYAAVGILAIGLSGMAGLNIYSNQVAEHNIAEQQEAENQLQQQIQEATFVIDNPLPAITFNVEKQSGDFHLVAGAFRVEENAEKKVNELKKEGYKARLIGANKYGLHQVVFSSHKTRREAVNALNKLKREDKAAWLLVQEL